MPVFLTEPNSLARLLEKISDAVLLLDVRGDVVLANPAAVRLLRKPMTEIIGLNLQRHFSFNDSVPCLDRPPDLAATDGPAHDCVFQDPAGSRVAFTMDIEFLGDEGPAAFAIFLRPLPDHPEPPGEFQIDLVLFQIVPDLRDFLKSRVEFFDPEAKNILGLDDLTRFEHCFQNVHPEDRPRIEQACRHIRQNDFPFDLTVRIFHPANRQWRTIKFFSDDVSRDPGKKTGFYPGVMADMTGAFCLEKELSQNQLDFKYLLESIRDVVWYTSADGQFRYISRAAREVYGRPEEEFYRDKNLWLNAVHPVDRTRVEKESRDVWTRHREVAIDYRIVRPDGEVRSILDRKKPIGDEEGRIIAIAGIATDITEQKMAEEELINKQYFIQRILDTSPNIIYIYDLKKQRNIFSNKQISSILGYSEEEVLEMGASLFETLLHPDDFPVIADNHQRLFSAADDEILDLEYRMRHKNGEWRWLFSRESVFSRSSDGSPRQKIGTALDITNRKQAEEQAIIFHRFAEASIEGFGIGSLDGRIHYINPALGRLVDRDPGDITGRSFLDYYPENQRQKLAEQVLPTVMEKGRWTGELKIFSAAGKISDTLENYFLIRDDRDQPLFWADIITDITERKRTEEELVRYKNHLEELVDERTRELKQKNIELEKQIEERLKAEKEQLKFLAFMENSRDFIGMWDLDGTIHYINRAGLDILGLKTLEEALVKKVSDFSYDPESRMLKHEILLEIRASGQWRGEGQLRSFKDGSRIDVNIDAFTVIDPESGRNVCVGAIMRDIRQLKSTEEALRDSTSKWRSIVEHAPDIILIVDRDSRIIFINRPSETFGFQETIGKSIRDHFPANRSAKVERIIDSVFETGDSKIFEIDLPVPDGRVIWHLNHVGAIKAGQEVVAAIVIIRDITERKQAENRIRQSEETAHALINAIQESAFLMEADGKVLATNDLTAQRLGLGFDEVMTRNMFDLLPPEVAELRRRKVEAAVRAKTVVRFQDERFGRIIQNTVSPVFDAQGEVSRLAILGVDITAHVEIRKKLETQTRELIRSNKDLEHFAYIASHDLQEPLRKITNFIELLAKRYKGHIDGRADRYIDYVLDGAERMRVLINDLLKYSRVGRVELSFAPVDLEKVFLLVLSDLRDRIEESGAVITHDPLPVVDANQLQIEQLLGNLLVNTLKFIGNENPVVHLGYYKNETEHVFKVTDNGIGIDPKYNEAIFQIFSRINSRLEYPGTGIGLAICKRIVERHGGRIWVESNPGSGSAFYFTLPKERTIS